MKKKHILLKVVEEEIFKFEVDDEKLNQIISILGKPVGVANNKTVESHQDDTLKSKTEKTAEKPDKRRKYQYDDAGIKRLMREGKSIPQIAEHFGIGIQSMRNYINNHESQWEKETFSDSEDD